MRTPRESVAAIVLAAGKGTRMKSELPKVLHPLCGKPMLGHVLSALDAARIRNKCVVVGGDVERLRSYLKGFEPLSFAVQKDRLGTGEAVACAASAFINTPIPTYASGGHLAGERLANSHVLICAGDTPAIDPIVIGHFLDDCFAQKTELAVLGMQHPQPTGYGRLVCDDKNQLIKIVEEKDASAQEKAIQICNSGMIFAERNLLFSLLEEVRPDNAQKEYYLTDCFALARKRGKQALVWTTPDFASFDGINDRAQLASLESRLLEKLRRHWMLKGVSFHLPESTYLDYDVILGEDCDIGPNVSLLGQTRLGRGCEIGSHTVLKNVSIPDSSKVPAGTVRLEV